MRLIVGILGALLALLTTGCPGGKALQSPTRGHSDVAFCLAPDGETVYFAAAGEGHRDLYSLRLSTGAVARVAQTPEYEETPTVSPDGSLLAYAASTEVGGPSHLFVRSLASGEVRQLTSGEVYDRHPTFSPDGSRIVFARAHRHRPYSMGGWTWDQWDVHVIHVDGTGLEQITRHGYYSLGRPVFSPVEDQLVYSASPMGTPVTYQISALSISPDATPKALWTQGRCQDPVYTGGGERIVFVSDHDEAFQYELYAFSPASGAATRLTHLRSYLVQPQFTPDGKSLFFLSDPKRSQRYELWQMGADGANPRRIAGPSLFDDPLNWRPDTGR